VRRPFALTATLFIVLLALCGSAAALDPSLDVNQYAHTSWKIRDGFVKGEISAIAQTPDGYLWLGTQFGLYRFDGIHATPWQPPGQQHLPRGWVRILLVSRDGTLWIGGADGLASFKDGKVTEYPELSHSVIDRLLEDHQGILWIGAIGSPTGDLCQSRDGKLHCYELNSAFGKSVDGLFEDSAGSLWVGVKDGLWKWKPGPSQYFPLAGQPDGIKPLGQDTDGALLVGWKERIYRFVEGKATIYPLTRNLPGFWAGRMFRDKDGAFWIGTRDGILHIRQGRTDQFSINDGLSGQEPTAFFEDREGSVWVSTPEGLDRFHNLAAARLTVKQGLSNNHVGSILADHDGSLWFATYGGLNRFGDGQITVPSTIAGMQQGKIDENSPQSLFQDDRGRIWLTTLFRGLGYLENGRFHSIEGVPGGNFTSITQDTSGNLWAASSNAGLFRISPRNDVLKFPWAGLGHQDPAIVLAADHARGGIWLGFFQGGVAYFSDEQVRKSYSSTDGLGSGRVSDFLFDHEGVLWISTEGGLSRFKNNHLTTLTSNGGLPCDTVHWAAEEDDGSLWLYTACGLERIARSELDGWVASAEGKQHSTRQVHATVYDESDGVKSLSVPSNYHPQVAKTPDGKLWFLPEDGVSVIAPHHLPFNKIPPPVHIEQITSDRRSFDASGNLRLPPLVRDLEVDYTALSLVAPEKNQFRYKLEGFDQDWQDVGNRRQAFYTNLPPRTYRFRVIACNNSGVWNETGDSFEFSIAPAYYQTIWFRILIAIAILAFIWALYRLRLSQMQRQFTIGAEARVNERTRIARELHDTLLQSLHGVMFQFQVARNMLPRSPDEAAKALDGAILETEQAIADSRDAIHDLRTELANSSDLGDLLNATGEELAGARSTDHHAPEFRLVVEGERRTLSAELQDEVFRIAHEILRNAFQHSRAKRIEAEIRYDDRELRLRVRDDGIGVDPTVLEQGGRPGHWGMRGVHERAKQIGATVDFWSEAGAGTEVQLTVPAAVAYDRSSKGSGSRRDDGTPYREVKGHE
jgi:ligand-binding sensor domain-containing protein/signal transduction histidine kinase